MSPGRKGEVGEIGNATETVPMRALVFDPFPIFLDVMTRLLTARGVDVPGATTSSRRLLELIDEHQPDLLLAGLDAAPKGTDVLRAVRAAIDRNPDLKVIVLAKRRDDDRISEVFAAGASAYVENDATPEDMLAAIRQSFRQSIHLAADRRVAPDTQGAEEVGLTDREEEVLKLVSEGYSNGELARMLWITTQTVKFHLTNIYRKLNVSNRTQASRWAQQAGFEGTKHNADKLTGVR